MSGGLGQVGGGGAAARTAGRDAAGSASPAAGHGTAAAAAQGGVPSVAEPAPIPTAESAHVALPADVFSTAKPVGRYPGRRHPRRGDLVLTIVLTAILLALAVVYVHAAIVRANTDARLVDGTQLANVLALLAPIVLSVFSIVFSALFVLRRIYAFWLPVVAGVLVVALYSVTEDMLASAIVSNFVR